jgi:hypothetical protein
MSLSAQKTATVWPLWGCSSRKCRMALGVWCMEVVLFATKLWRRPQVGKMHFVGRLYVFVGGGTLLRHIQVSLGHASSTTTEIYTHVSTAE